MNKLDSHLKHNHHYILMLSEIGGKSKMKQRIIHEWIFSMTRVRGSGTNASFNR